MNIPLFTNQFKKLHSIRYCSIVPLVIFYKQDADNFIHVHTCILFCFLGCFKYIILFNQSLFTSSAILMFQCMFIVKYIVVKMCHY